MDTVVAQHGTPFTIEDLAQVHNFTPKAFEAHFESFDALNKTIFKIFMDNALQVLAETPEYFGFSKKDKLLSLYYTLFENLTLNRHFVLLTIKSYGLNLNTLSLFNELKERFTEFVGTLEMETIRLHDTLDSFQKKSVQEGLWVQFLLTLKFWMSDESPNCQKTDIFIEKSVNTGVELLNTKSLHNIIDLGKFLYAEKIKSK